MDREFLEQEIKKLDGQIEILTRQIDNSDRNITGLVAQKTRHMDRRDMLETRKTELETELASLPDESEQPLE
jgi:chromosome segregation ATPase